MHKIKNKQELLKRLKNKETPEALALAYLVNELIPNDRTTKRVFRRKAVK